MEDIIIVAIVFGSMLAALKLVLEFVQSKKGGERADRSLTTGELSGMIDESVQRSLATIEKRIEHLEAIVVDEPVAAHRTLEAPEETSDTELDTGSSPARERVARRQ